MDPLEKNTAEQEPAPEDAKAEKPKVKLEKGDLPALLIAAFLNFILPIMLVLAFICFLAYAFFTRFQ